MEGPTEESVWNVRTPCTIDLMYAQIAKLSLFTLSLWKMWLAECWQGFFRCQTAAGTVTTEQLAGLNYTPKNNRQQDSYLWTTCSGLRRIFQRAKPKWLTYGDMPQKSPCSYGWQEEGDSGDSAAPAFWAKASRFHREGNRAPHPPRIFSPVATGFG